MKKFILIFLLITANLVFAEGIPFKPQTDVFQLGRGDNGDVKEFIFDSGLGVNNPKLETDTLGTFFLFNKKLTIIDDITLGDGTPNDRNIIIDEGSGGNNPRITWDTTTNKWKQFDGTTERDIGAGGGGGADAINILADKNPGAEDGILSWTFAGTGAFTTTNVLAEIHTGEKSFSTDFDAQNETLKSFEKTIPQGLYAQACQARFHYIGGDDSIDITVTIRDGNDAIVPGSESKILKVATIWTIVDLSFSCANATQIAGDAELGNLYLEFKQTGVGDADLFRHDEVHLGGLIGLVEATLPDHFSAFISSTGAITTESTSFLSGSCAKTTPANFSQYVCPFNSGIFTIVPACIANKGTAATLQVVCSVDVDATTISNVTVKCQGQDTSGVLAGQDAPFTLFCDKQGVDAKQSVTTYRPLPRIHENVNSISFTVSTTGVISGELPGDVINGNCTDATGDHTCTFNADVFTVTSHCYASIVTGAVGDTTYQIKTISSSSVQIKTFLNGVLNSFQTDVLCLKQGIDFEFPTVRPFAVGQVINSLADGGGLLNVRVEGCRVANNGTATTHADSGLCDSWLLTVNRVTLGRVTFSMVSGIFTNPPICFAGPISGARCCSIDSAVSASSGAVTCDTCDTNTALDVDFNLTCLGVRQ